MKETELIFFEENNKLFNNFLQKYFYNDFRKEKPSKNIELILSPYCDQECSYCYLNKNYKNIYTDFNEQQSLKNLDRLLLWYNNNNFNCDIDLFSGELFFSNFGFQILEKILIFFKDKKNKPRKILIPTNYSFIFNDEKTKEIERLLSLGREVGIKIYLSASIDGKYMDNNRPLKNTTLVRDDKYYDKVFAFNKKHGFMFHSMIYAEGIENWKKNFDWFQENFKQYDIPIDFLSLLQVRNNNWNIISSKKLYDFILYIFDFYYNHFNQDSLEFFNFVKESNNTLLNGFFKKNEAQVSCSLQFSLAIRLNDMKVFSCHRLIYPELEIGYFDEKMNFNTKNAELGIITFGQNNNFWPLCYDCPIKDICQKGCMGAQFEEYQDGFIPIKTVCLNYFYLNKGLVDGCYKTGIADYILELKPSLKNNFNFLQKMEL